jgi:hypothetical protein
MLISTLGLLDDELTLQYMAPATAILNIAASYPAVVACAYASLNFHGHISWAFSFLWQYHQANAWYPGPRIVCTVDRCPDEWHALLHMQIAPCKYTGIVSQIVGLSILR